MLKFLLRPIERWVRKIARQEIDETPTTVSIQKVEVTADDPERFMQRVIEAAGRHLRS